MRHHSRLVVLCAAAAAFMLLGSSCKLTNKAPSVPTISGPTAGVAGVSVTFTATTVDPDGDSISVMFDWGDGATPAWTSLVASGDTITVSNTYADSGTFTIKAKAKDKNGKESGWSAGQALSLIAAGPMYPDTVVGTIAAPWFALSSCISRDGTLLGLGSESGHDSIAIVRTSDRTLLCGVGVGGLVPAIAISPDNRYAYGSSTESGTGVVWKMDIAEARIVASASVRAPSYELVVTPDGSRVLLGQDSAVLFLDGDDLGVLDSVKLPADVEWLTLNRAGTALYVTTNLGIGAVDVQACSLRAFRETDYAWSLALSADELVLYVSSHPDSGLLALRADDLSVLQHINLHYRSAPGFVTASPDGRHLYLGCGTLRVIDLRTSAEIDTLGLPACDGLLLQPSGDSLYYIGGRTIYVIGKRQ